MGRFLGVVLRPGEAVTLSECTLVQAALADPSTGACSVYANDQLIIKLDAIVPQRPLAMLLGPMDAVIVRCEGAAGAPGVHLIGRAASTRRASVARKRPHAEAAAAVAPPAEAVAAVAPPAEDTAAAPPAEQTFISPAERPSSRKRTPRLTFSPDVLVAEYFPKRSGIYPERTTMTLDEMDERAKERLLAEANAGEDEDPRKPAPRPCLSATRPGKLLH